MRRLLLWLLPLVLFAQPKSAVAPDEEAYKNAPLPAILQYFTRYPNARGVSAMIDRAFAASPRDADHARELAADILKRLAKASPTARSDAERAIALRLSARTATLHDAEAYAREAIAHLNADDFISREREGHPLPFYPDEAREKFRTAEAAAWSTLGRILIKQGRDSDARQALQKSLAAARTAEAASAFADLAAKEGDVHTVLDALGTAILTGKADRLTIDRFQTAYSESGMRPNPEQWLDRRYRMEWRNPLDPPPYRGATATPHRTVLLEIATGAACQPCVSIDLAADALLRRYARQDLVLVARHTQAPLAIPSQELRTAPGVWLDGEAIQPGEGLASVAKPVFDTLDAAIQARIAIPAAATIQLRSHWTGAALHVEALVEHSAGARLQLYLLETEVSYSGENAIRLHPMVLRGEAGGFDVAGDSFPAQWTFAAASRKLAIVAVLQDPNTRRVLQSAFLPVEGML